MSTIIPLTLFCACANKNLFCSVRLAQLGDRHLSVILFGREMKKYYKFTTISNSVDTRGVCWLFGWGYVMIKVRTKCEKRLKSWDFPWRLVLRCWCLTSMNHELACGGDREIFVTIIEGSLLFDLILLQLWNKIALSSRRPPSLKSLQITSSFLSLCSHIGHKT